MTRPRATMICILLYILVWAVRAVVGCDSGMFGESCDRNCSLSCALYPGKNVRICEKDTGNCLGGCFPGWHGDHCNLTCSKNCIDNICNQKDGRCTKGCAGKYKGDFCNKEIVPDNGCPPGQFGDACDHVCPPQCAVGCGQSVGTCERDTGKCHDGCRPGWHGDHCNLTSMDLFMDYISKMNHTSNQGNRDQVSIPNKEGMLTTLVILTTVLVIMNVIWSVINLIKFCRRRKRLDRDYGTCTAQDREGKNLLKGPTNGVETEKCALDVNDNNTDSTHQAVDGHV